MKNIAGVECCDIITISSTIARIIFYYFVLCIKKY